MARRGRPGGGCTSGGFSTEPVTATTTGRPRNHIIERPHGVDRQTPVRHHPIPGWPFLLSGTGAGIVANVPKPPRPRKALLTKSAKRQRDLLKAAGDAPF